MRKQVLIIEFNAMHISLVSAIRTAINDWEDNNGDIDWNIESFVVETDNDSVSSN
jgi:hypothetical protein